MYAVYMIVYYGDKFPKKNQSHNRTPNRYIGSAKIDSIKGGYLGSVASKKYKNLWKEETRQNPNLFKLRILSKHDTGVEAREEEKRLQLKYSVVKSERYVNLSLASPNGFFGRNDTGRVFSEETKRKQSSVRKGKTYEEIYGPERGSELRELRRKQTPHNKGAKTPQEFIDKSKESRKGLFFITDGISDRKVKCESLIPEGWRRGRTNGVSNSENTSFRRQDVKEKIQITRATRREDYKAKPRARKSEEERRRRSRHNSHMSSRPVVIALREVAKKQGVKLGGGWYLKDDILLESLLETLQQKG